MSTQQQRGQTPLRQYQNELFACREDDIVVNVEAVDGEDEIVIGQHGQPDGSIW